MPPAAPKWRTSTLILDNGKPVARLDAALWPSVGAFVKFADRHPARVRSVRLKLELSTATIVIDVESAPN